MTQVDSVNVLVVWLCFWTIKVFLTGQRTQGNNHISLNLSIHADRAQNSRLCEKHPESNIPMGTGPTVQYAIENMSLIISVIRDS